MILLDASALICGIRKEPEIGRLRQVVESSRLIAIGAPILLEAGMVLDGRNIDSRLPLHQFVDALGAEILDFRAEHYSMALSAFMRFGKGRHPAALNFGDCLSYSYAQITGLTLVYKGEDFGLTDLPRLERLDA